MRCPFIVIYVGCGMYRHGSEESHTQKYCSLPMFGYDSITKTKEIDFDRRFRSI